MNKSIFVICDKDGNPFSRGSDGSYYKRTWAFQSFDEAKENCIKGEKPIEYKPAKG
jgi:hypothetical protein